MSPNDRITILDYTIHGESDNFTVLTAKVLHLGRAHADEDRIVTVDDQVVAEVGRHAHTCPRDFTLKVVIAKSCLLDSVLSLSLFSPPGAFIACGTRYQGPGARAWRSGIGGRGNGGLGRSAISR